MQGSYVIILVILVNYILSASRVNLWKDAMCLKKVQVVYFPVNSPYSIYRHLCIVLVECHECSHRSTTTNKSPILEAYVQV